MAHRPKLLDTCGRKRHIQGLHSMAWQRLPMAMLRIGEGSNRCPTFKTGVKTGDSEQVLRAFAWRAERWGACAAFSARFHKGSQQAGARCAKAHAPQPPNGAGKSRTWAGETLAANIAAKPRAASQGRLAIRPCFGGLPHKPRQAARRPLPHTINNRPGGPIQVRGATAVHHGSTQGISALDMDMFGFRFVGSEQLGS